MRLGWVLSHGPVSGPHLCAAHRVPVDARGRGALPWTHVRSPPVQRAGCSWMLVDGVLYHGPMSESYLLQRPGCSWALSDGMLSHEAMSVSYVCSAQDASACSWIGCSHVDP